MGTVWIGTRNSGIVTGLGTLIMVAAFVVAAVVIGVLTYLVFS